MFEVMVEGQVIVEGNSFLFLCLFYVIVMLNFIEYEGIYVFFEVQLDCFMVCFVVGYFLFDEELWIIFDWVWRQNLDVCVEQVIDIVELVVFQVVVEWIYVDGDIVWYSVDFVWGIWDVVNVVVGVLLCGFQVLVLFGCVLVVFDGWDYVCFDDFKCIVEFVFVYCFILMLQVWVQGMDLCFVVVIVVVMMLVLFIVVVCL